MTVLAVLSLCPIQAQRLQVMTYNIRHGEGMDEVIDYDRQAEVIRKSGAEVVAVQEVDSATARVEGDDLLGELASRLKMYPYFSAAIDYRGGKYGVGLLSKQPAQRITRIPLPGREEPRTLLVAEFADYVFCSTHLSLTPEDSEASVAILREVARQFKGKKPVLVAGDMNNEPGSPFTTELLRDFDVLNDMTIPTFPSDQPREMIDYVAVGKDAGVRVKVKKREVVADSMASDHRPVYLKLRLKTKF